MHDFSADAVISRVKMVVRAERLIEIVKSYPILYDLADEDYKNIRKKDKIWEQIGLELGASGDELKRKWKNLKDTYAKHLRSLNTATGQNVQKKLKKWQWAKHMEAFRPFMSLPKTKSNINNITATDNTDDEIVMTLGSPTSDTQPDELTSDTGEDNDCMEIEETSTSSKNKSQAFPIKRKKKTETRQEFPTAELPKCLKQNPKWVNSQGDMDAIDLIFSGYAKIVKTFSPRMQVVAKLKLAGLMSQLELKHQQETIGAFTSRPSTRRSSRVDDSTSYMKDKFA